MAVMHYLMEVAFCVGVFYVMHILLQHRFGKTLITIHPDIDNWIDIKENPVSYKDCELGFFRDEIIITDGKKVETITRLRYNSDGKLIMPYSNNLVTHWQPMPKPPKKKKK